MQKPINYKYDCVRRRARGERASASATTAAVCLTIIVYVSVCVCVPRVIHFFRGEDRVNVMYFFRNVCKGV